MASFNIESLFIHDVHVNSKGIKTAALSTTDKQPLQFAASTSKAPFGPSNFDKDETAIRQNLEIRLQQEHIAFFEKLDEYMIQYLSVNSERLLKTTDCRTS